MVDPNQMEFDEDIVLIMKTLMKKHNAVSEIVWTMVPTLEKVFMKNKESMGNLLPTINHLLIYGRELFMAQPDKLEVIMKIADLSLFTKQNI